MNMEELARLAGVSLSAVSKAFSGSRDINEEKRQHIFRVAKEAGCYYKYIKPKLYMPIIAVICNELYGGYTPKLLYWIDKQVSRRGGTIITGCDNFDSERRRMLMSYFSENVGVSGIILCNSLNEHLDSNVPVVVIGESDIYDSVDMSWKRAIYDAVDHFRENGHERIAFIGEEYSVLKNAYFMDAISELGLNIDERYIIQSSQRFELAGYEAMNKLLDMDEPPTAVLAAYDNIALGAMKSITEHGLKIPDDISIIGMNDNNESSFLNIPLTTGTAYPEDLCEIVANLIFNKINDNNSGHLKKIKVSAELVKRGSVGPAKK